MKKQKLLEILNEEVNECEMAIIKYKENDEAYAEYLRGKRNGLLKAINLMEA